MGHLAFPTYDLLSRYCFRLYHCAHEPTDIWLNNERKSLKIVAKSFRMFFLSTSTHNSLVLRKCQSLTECGIFRWKRFLYVCKYVDLAKFVNEIILFFGKHEQTVNVNKGILSKIELHISFDDPQ